MFEKMGIKTISSLAVFVLPLLDGKHSVEDIIKYSQTLFNCTKDGYIVRGHRHHHAIRAMKEIPRYQNDKAPFGDDQGFVTSRGRYVNRKEALVLQRMAGISSVAPSGYRGSELYSEDVY